MGVFFSLHGWDFEFGSFLNLYTNTFLLCAYRGNITAGLHALHQFFLYHV